MSVSETQPNLPILAADNSAQSILGPEKSHEIKGLSYLNTGTKLVLGHETELTPVETGLGKSLNQAITYSAKVASIAALAIVLLAPHQSWANTTPLPGEGETRDVIVLSDLHLGGGTQSLLDDFRRDLEFSQMVSHFLERQKRTKRPLTLALAGDIFEFRKRRSVLGNEQHRKPISSVKRLQAIAKGHPKVFQALGRVAAAGNNIVVISGNHDPDMNFQLVQDELRSIMATEAPTMTQQQLSFSPWFYLVGNAMIEHGHRYEPTTTIDYMLCFSKPNDTLRFSAADHLVEELVTPLQEKYGHLLCQKVSPRGLWQWAKAIPRVLGDIFRFAAKMTLRIGEPDAQRRARLEYKHYERMREFISNQQVVSKLNSVRQSLGQRPIDRTEAMILMRRFDDLSAPSTMFGQRPSGGKIRRALSLLTPKKWSHWLDPAKGGTITKGKEFAFGELGVDVLVSGHTHAPRHNIYVAPYDRAKHHLDSGTWAQMDTGPNSIGRAKLSFVELQIDLGRAAPRLCRWDVDSDRPQSCVAKLMNTSLLAADHPLLSIYPDLKMGRARRPPRFWSRSARQRPKATTGKKKRAPSLHARRPKG
jgi:UDP-2,3-diacylglucosamine pyrophosphatase LpxH